MGFNSGFKGLNVPVCTVHTTLNTNLVEMISNILEVQTIPV